MNLEKQKIKKWGESKREAEEQNKRSKNSSTEIPETHYRN